MCNSNICVALVLHSATDMLVIAAFLFFVSFSISYIRPCKSLIMNASLSFHLMLLDILGVDFALWMEGSSFSSEILALPFVIFPAISHTLILIWASCKIICWTYSHCKCHTLRSLFKTLVPTFCRKYDYELCDSQTLVHN